MFDKNGDGRITKKELNDSLENMGIFIPDPELSQMIEKIDVNGDRVRGYRRVWGSVPVHNGGER